MGGLAAFEATNVLATVEERGERDWGWKHVAFSGEAPRYDSGVRVLLLVGRQNEASGFSDCKRNCLGGVPIIFLDMHVL